MTKAHAQQADNMIVLMEHEAFGVVFDKLYAYGMALIEETAAYIDGEGKHLAKTLSSSVTNLYTAEAMRMSTRLMQVASWLLLIRAGREKEMSEEQIAAEKAKVSLETPSKQDIDPDWLQLPQNFRDLVMRSLQLEERVRRLDHDIDSIIEPHEEVHNPVARQIGRIQDAFDRR